MGEILLVALTSDGSASPMEVREIVDDGILGGRRERPAVRFGPCADCLDPDEERLAGLLGDHLAEQGPQELDLAGEGVARTGRADSRGLGQDRRVRSRTGPGARPC